jgi:hypothetical protein
MKKVSKNFKVKPLNKKVNLKPVDSLKNLSIVKIASKNSF